MLDQDDNFEYTHLVIAGDQNQFPPVFVLKPAEKMRPVLGNLFEYYVVFQQIKKKQLLQNYRSRAEIVEITRNLGLYEPIEPR